MTGSVGVFGAFIDDTVPLIPCFESDRCHIPLSQLRELRLCSVSNCSTRYTSPGGCPLPDVNPEPNKQRAGFRIQ